ncbi:MAG: SDR family NAD(P)-dependent oxidoreductase [Acidobacteriota bacterium]|jgi:acetoacetyl-CoA reductase/3-oxoacyl-[acyl-carrier protein] reductase
MYLITGASRGIGKYLFEKFSGEGETVFGTYNHTRPQNLESGKLFKVDISDCKQISDWISRIKAELNEVVLINCAGTNYNAIGHKSDMGKWAEVINVNLVGTFHVIGALLPIMRDQNWGRIINLSSVVAQLGIPGTSAYSASKSGLWGLARALAAENAKKGITINNLNLGYFDIGMITEVPPEFQQVLKAKIPTGQFGNPENIYRAVKFIVSNDYLNGTSIDISAGLV